MFGWCKGLRCDRDNGNNNSDNNIYIYIYIISTVWRERIVIAASGNNGGDSVAITYSADVINRWDVNEVRV